MDGVPWCELGPRVFQALPFSSVLNVSPNLSEEITFRLGALAIRFCGPSDLTWGRESYHVVADRLDMEMERLPKRGRYNVRSGLQRSTTGAVEWSLAAREGWRLRDETLNRQGRGDAETSMEWRRLCEIAAAVPGFVAWGASRGGRLCALLIAAVDSKRRVASIYLQQSEDAALRDMVNNALAYSFCQSVFESGAADRVFYGMESLDAAPTVDEFKFHMGFRRVPVKQCVAVHPGLAAVGHWDLAPILQRLGRFGSLKNFTNKMNGLLAVHRAGLRSEREL